MCCFILAGLVFSSFLSNLKYNAALMKELSMMLMVSSPIENQKRSKQSLPLMLFSSHVLSCHVAVFGGFSVSP